MRRTLVKENSSALFTCIFCLLFCANANVNAAEAANLILLNGNIYTINERQPQAQAVAVAKDHIIFVGSNEEAKKLATPQTRIVDLAGKTVAPGLTDSHCHIFGIGEREMHLNLEGTNTREDFLRNVKERVAQTEPGKWIVGRGWIETFWKPPQFPTRRELDQVAPRNPVYLTRADGHASVVNTAALKIAKIDKHTPDPFGGQIFVFRGRRGYLLKALWWDGQGLCLFAKRLEKGRFVWPSPADGCVVLTPAQLGMLLEGIDWRMPVRTWHPHAAG